MAKKNDPMPKPEDAPRLVKVRPAVEGVAARRLRALAAMKPRPSPE